MTGHYHTVIWIDHRQARIFGFGREDVERLVVQSDSPTRHIHHKADTTGQGRDVEDKEFFRHVAEAVADSKAILITGPSSAKTELMKYIHHRMPRLIEHIAGVETVDHPSDGALIAHARAYFKADHQVLPRAGVPDGHHHA